MYRRNQEVPDVEERVTFDTVYNVDIMLEWCLSEPVSILPNDDVSECYIRLKGKKKLTIKIGKDMKPVDFILAVAQGVKKVVG